MADVEPFPGGLDEDDTATTDKGQAGEAESGAISLIEESVHVGKRTVDTGGYRLTKRLTTREETVDELLRDERVVVERCPRGVTLEGLDVPDQRYEGDVLIIPVIEEVLITEKRLVLVEEIRVTRIRGTHRESQRVTLRKEEVSVERLDADELSASEPS